MKVIAVFSAIMAVSSAQILYNGGLGYTHGLGYASGLGYTSGLGHIGYNGLTYSAVAPAIASVPIATATKTQYHSQDELGQAAFGHSEPTQSHHAVRDAAGGVRGSFSYISAEGIPLTTNYIADHNGYRVASNALPVAPAVSIAGPVDTPEVAAAKVQHAHAHALARSGRAKRGLVSTYNTAPFVHHGASIVGAPAWGYSTYAAAAPALTYAAAPAVTYAAAPAVTYAAAPAVTYAAAPAVTYAAAAPAAVTYSAAIAPAATHVVAAPHAVRSATLTKVVNTPGHAVSYRVD